VWGSSIVSGGCEVSSLQNVLSDALERIDEVNSADPRNDAATNLAKELLYGRRMSAWLARFSPGSSASLQVACRGQHIARWRWPRSEYPDGRVGYKTWRRNLLTRHAEVVGEILSSLKVPQREQDRVRELITKQQRQVDPESQTLEDIACLVFLEFEFEAFAAKHDRAKVIRIVKKTWQKMSENAHTAALQLELPEALGALVHEALVE